MNSSDSEQPSRRAALGRFLPLAAVLAALAAAAAAVVALNPSDTLKAAPVPSTSRPPAEQLRALDTAAGLPNLAPEADYELAFATLAARCQEQDAGLAAEVRTVLELLRKDGDTEENELTVMQHLAALVPSGLQTNCSQAANAYVTIRQGSH
ncbi:hypothetical protein GCM10009665_43470 [Kitasatospora nipponensis]|uniref:Uncharacterized protein n=1 Tax=Kitasatospora nipponensis TaxID=258049 RepID=A0ABN1WKZ6_9ACTN